LEGEKREKEENLSSSPLLSYSSPSSPTTSKRYAAPAEFAGSFLASPSSKKQFRERLKRFFDSTGVPGKSLEEQGQAFLARAKNEGSTDNNKYWAEDSISSFLEVQIMRFNKGEIAAASIPALLSAIKAFCETHKRDYFLSEIDWQRLSRMLPKAKSHANDRAYSLEEIRKLVRFPDRRIKPMVYVMCSSGIRVGAWENLKWKHVIPKRNDKGELLAAKLIVYDEDGDQYFSFITPEAYNELEEWMKYREECGEKITGNSPLMRDLWRTVDMKRGGGGDNDGGRGKNRSTSKRGGVGRHRKGGRFGLVTMPKPLRIETIEKRLSRALKAQGLRGDLPEGERRHGFKQAHGLRKFFKTTAQAAHMLHANVEYLMGHRESYFRPVEDVIFQDYLKAVDSLTIEDNHKAISQKQLAELEEKRKEDNNFFARKLIEKERELEALHERSKKAVAELLESRLKQFQESIEAKYDRLSAELLRQNERRLKEMNEKEREREMEVLTVLGPEALEEELEEEEAAKRAAAVKIYGDDKGNPIPTFNENIDWSVEEGYDAENLEFTEE
jgi:hypothetical protein